MHVIAEMIPKKSNSDRYISMLISVHNYAYLTCTSFILV